MKMKIRTVLTLTATALLLSSCIPSVNPFYTERDVVWDARLTGEWQEADKAEDPEIWKFEKSEGKTYKLTVQEQGKQGLFDAHLFRLKGEYFLDLIPVECNYATNQADLVAASMIPGHLLVRVTELEPGLKLAFFDFDWLEKYLKKNPKALAHHHEDHSIVLTAETRDLQRFVLEHLGEGGLFAKPGRFVRRTNSVSAPP
jgi:hypothetical protein